MLLIPDKKENGFASQREKPGSDTEGGDEPHGLDDDDGAAVANTSADAILRDFRYRLQCMYMEPQRDLRVLVIDLL